MKAKKSNILRYCRPQKKWILKTKKKKKKGKKMRERTINYELKLYCKIYLKIIFLKYIRKVNAGIKYCNGDENEDVEKR